MIMKTPEKYIDEYGVMILFFPILVPILFVARLWIVLGGWLLDKVIQPNDNK